MTKFGNQLQQYAQGTDVCLHPINQTDDRPDGSVFCNACQTQVREPKASRPADPDRFLRAADEIENADVTMPGYVQLFRDADATIAAQQAEIATQASRIKGLEVFARRITRTDLSPERFVEWAQDYAESVLNS